MGKINLTRILLDGLLIGGMALSRRCQCLKKKGR